MEPLAMLGAPAALLLLSHAFSLGGRHAKDRRGAHGTVGDHHLRLKALQCLKSALPVTSQRSSE